MYGCISLYLYRLPAGGITWFLVWRNLQSQWIDDPGGSLLVFPNCFHITLGKPKFPLIFLGKCYTSLLDILPKYLLDFNALHFSSCTIHTQEVAGSNPAAPTIT